MIVKTKEFVAALKSLKMDQKRRRERDILPRQCLFTTPLASDSPQMSQA